MQYNYLLIRVFAPIINLFVFIVNLFIRRDTEIALFGAWMGKKYADNTRYLYQYLQKNIEKYNLKKIIWVTRSESTFKLLTNMGLEVYMMHSYKSFYYHIKAGVHVVCNINFPVKGYSGDIMGQLSGCAIKINTWHGIPIKAGKTTGDNSKKAGLLGTIKHSLRGSKVFQKVFTPGHWDKAYYLSTGPEGTRRSSVFCGVGESQFIESGYPRDCKTDLLLDNEKNVIFSFEHYSKVFLFLPTFREKGQVPHPLEDNSLRQFIRDNDILWVEKPHAATKVFKKEDNSSNILYLDSDFDINVILDEVDLVITDYSSVCYDAMAYNTPVVYYAPDIQFYMCNERGFLCDYKSMVKDFLATTIPELQEFLDDFLNDKEFIKRLNDQITIEKNTTLNKQALSCEEIVSIINNYTGAFKTKQ